ncbi:MAG: exonuclease SbcCD subunit D [Lachnospiraceae bacterium]|jgi:exonuclease SbcD
MKLLHLSDLHIGKRVHGFSMLEDQIYILDQILDIIRTERAEGVILAGDIYDKPIPSAEAVQVFDTFLNRLADEQIMVFAVSGNHDSPERLAFGSHLMDSRGVYLSPVYDGQIKQISFTDAYGELVIHLLPYIKPAVARQVWKEDKIESYEDAVRAAIWHMEIDPAKRNILVAHQFVAGASNCESEELLVGGLDQIPASIFDGFDYVALGHLHSPQYVERETIRYCGTPLKYSFSEENQKKSVILIECREKGEIAIRKILLQPLRDMRSVRGKYLEVTDLSGSAGLSREDYIKVILTDEEDIPDGLQKLQAIYPHLMQLEYDNVRTRENRKIESAEAAEEKSELELFMDFYELQNNQPMSEVQKQYVTHMIQDIWEEV